MPGLSPLPFASAQGAPGQQAGRRAGQRWEARSSRWAAHSLAALVSTTATAAGGILGTTMMLARPLRATVHRSIAPWRGSPPQRRGGDTAHPSTAHPIRPHAPLSISIPALEVVLLAPCCCQTLLYSRLLARAPPLLSCSLDRAARCSRPPSRSRALQPLFKLAVAVQQGSRRWHAPTWPLVYLRHRHLPPSCLRTEWCTFRRLLQPQRLRQQAHLLSTWGTPT